MPFQKVTPEKLSDAVKRQIEGLVLQGVLRAGERLPSERDLAEQLGVSRPSLRDALADLQADGLLTARPGAGVFIADVLGSAFSPALVGLFARHSQAVFDYLAFRKDLEGLAAARAADFGTDADLKNIQSVFDAMARAHETNDAAAEARLDAEFHMAICEASHNVVMLHMLRSMFDLLQQGVFYNRQRMFMLKAGRADLFAQHQAINAALQTRDSGAARKAVEAHLDYVRDRLRDQLRAEEHQAHATQ